MQSSTKESKKAKRLSVSGRLAFKNRKGKGIRNTIYARADIGGKYSVPVSTGIRLEPSESFDTRLRQVIGNEHKNAMIQKMIADFDEAFYTLTYLQKTVTSEKLLAHVLAHKSAYSKVPTLLQAFSRFIEEVKRPLFATGNLHVRQLYHYTCLYKNMTVYLAEKYPTDKDIELADITPAFGDAYYVYQLAVKQYAPNHARKNVIIVKAVLQWCLMNEYVNRNVLDHFKAKVQKPEISYLTEREIKQIDRATILSVVIEKVRDFFLFQIETGVAYSDLVHLRPDHIVNSEHGKAIVKKREKTSVTASVYLTDKALDILAKYKDNQYCIKNGVCFPVMTNQKYNNYLKELQHISGVKMPITSHLARRTAATRMLNAGASLDTVAYMLGHADSRMTRAAYAEMKNETVIKNLKEAYKNLQLNQDNQTTQSHEPTIEQRLLG